MSFLITLFFIPNSFHFERFFFKFRKVVSPHVILFLSSERHCSKNVNSKRSLFRIFCCCCFVFVFVYLFICLFVVVVMWFFFGVVVCLFVCFYILERRLFRKTVSQTIQNKKPISEQRPFESETVRRSNILE